MYCLSFVSLLCLLVLNKFKNLVFTYIICRAYQLLLLCHLQNSLKNEYEKELW